MPEKSDATFSASVDDLIAETAPVIEVVEVVDDRPEHIKHPPADQVVVAQVPECDGDGSVARMQFFNAAGERVR
jgi:hypothetical protein